LSVVRWFSALRGRRQLAAEPAPIERPARVGPPPPTTVAVEVYTARDAFRLEIDCAGERTTDVLNHGGVLRGRQLIDDAEASPLDGGSFEIPVDDVLLVIPPEQPTNPQRRLHRPRQTVRVKIGSYEVTGDAHVPAGAQVSGFLARVAPRFVPLTDAVIRDGADARLERRVPVALTNYRAASAVKEVRPEDPVRPD
jgi:hypothetical protein